MLGVSMYLVNYYYHNGAFAGFTYYDTLEAAQAAAEQSGLSATIHQVEG